MGTSRQRFAALTETSTGSHCSSVVERFVGNITTNSQVRSDSVDYWNQITPENEGKWGSVEGSAAS